MAYPYPYQMPSYYSNNYMPPQSYQQSYQQSLQQAATMQDGTIQARFVSGREEAVAANVIPGSMCLFIDRANKKVYSKLIDSQTGMPDFREYAETQPEQAQHPQYATVEDITALEQRIEQKLATMQLKSTGRKVVNINDE